MPERVSPTEADYGWVEDWGAEAFCLALVEGSNPKDVLTGLVGDPVVGPGPADEARAWADEQDLPDYANTIEASVMDGWTVAFEDNGYQATLPEVVTALSVGTRVVVLFRNVNAVTQFIYALEGQIVRSFEPPLYDNDGPRSAIPLPEEAGLAFDIAHHMAAAFACAERLSGLRLTQELLDERDNWLAIGHYPTYSLPGARNWREARAEAERRRAEEEQEEEARAQAYHVQHFWAGRAPSPRLATVGGNIFGLVRLDRDLLNALEAAGADTQRAIAQWAARQAYAMAGLIDLDWVQAGFEALESHSGLPPPFTNGLQVFKRYRADERAPDSVTEGDESVGLPEILQQAAALPALQAASEADPLRAAIDALWAAAVTYGPRYPDLLAELRQRFQLPVNAD